MIRKIERCRICGGSDLELVVDLGVQMLTGVFPRSRDEPVTRGPLQLLKCSGRDACGLLQLAHSYEPDEVYGDNYGYRSGLNASMVAHLQTHVRRLTGLAGLQSGDLVLDIGSNDGTTLNTYDVPGLRLVGVDPTGRKFRQYYKPNVELIPDFFSSRLIGERYGLNSVKAVTSISMFYDLESPMDFMREIHDVLRDDGVWVFEQSYMPRMLETNSYDTICHEHLEFYGLTQIKWMTDRVGFRIVDVAFNDVNGGSFAVTVRKAGSSEPASPAVDAVLAAEASAGLASNAPYLAFEKRIRASRDELLGFLRQAAARGETVAGLGASTKGNVLLQYCGLTEKDIIAIGEVNPDKFGAFTPGTWIPIVPQDELLRSRPDYLLVLPWHFRAFFEKADVLRGSRLVYPLPTLSIVQR
jgi:NDP-4-keto-2,6-dideoxyhexose 3-C-methyltransferase